MKVVFLSGSRSSAAGGIFEVERCLAQKLRHRHAVEVEAAGLLDEGTARDERAWEETRLHCFPIVGPKQFGYSPKLKAWLKSSHHDLLHLHNLWMYMSLLALGWHRRHHRPFLVSPHGMLDPWALRNSGWKKSLAGALYEKAMLKSAAVIHAFHEKDLRDIRAYGLRNPVAVIPNGVELDTLPTVRPPREKRLLFLGRIHPKKGLSELVQGWSRVEPHRRAGWRLVVAGWDDGGHLPGLQHQVSLLGIGDSVEFVGPIFGEEKQKLLASSGGFVLPSLSEGLPMTVLEAWAHEVPAILTEMCNLPQGFCDAAAIRIEPNAESIADGLSRFLDMAEAERDEMGKNGRCLVERDFTWDKVSDQFMAVYLWMLGKGTRPDCVSIDT